MALHFEKRNKPKKKSIVKNYFYNLIYQLFLIIVPLAVTPYVARVLGADGSGQYSFTFSICTYFTLVAALGFGYYAQREIAKNHDDSEKQSAVFWEVIIARLIPVAVTIIVYLTLLLTNVYEARYNSLMWILSIDVIAVAFDISFFFQGNEEFGKIVLRNVLIKTASIVCIFVFVKKESDLGLYALIQSLSVILSNVSLWLYLPKLLKKVSIKDIKPLRHLLPTLILFLPTIATSVYTTLDKTLIGLITGLDSENGNYEYAEKLVKMALVVITSLGAVLIPRNSQKFADGDMEGVRQNIYKSARFVFFVGVPLMLGMIAVSDNLIPWYLGEGYDKAINLIKLLSPIIVIIGLSNVFGLQYLIPSGNDKKFTIAIVSGAIINLSLNLLLIYYWQSYGAAVATIIAETIVTGVMLFFIRKDIKFVKILISSWKYVLSGAVMFVSCFFVGRMLNPSILNTFLIVLLGVAVYSVMIILLRDSFVLDALRKITGKFIKKKSVKTGDKNMKYDYLIVGAGLYGATFAREAVNAGKKVLVIDKRPHVAGNIYTEEVEGINVHKYGAHIFHTNDKKVWEYVNRFAEFNRYTNSPVANYKGELYSLPFNMYTFNKMWGVVTPDEAAAKIEEQRNEAGITEPRNLEEQAISLVGTDIYEKLVKGYTQKQWGRPCTELPSFIIKRLPVRLTFDNNYFNALYQGIPVGGYTKLVENMLDGIEVRLNTDYLENKSELDKLADKVVYTGAIDAYFGYSEGALEYRSVRFETEVLDKPNFQGNAVVNYTDAETPFTRIIEHKFFEFGTQPKTVISREYSSEWKVGDEPYYPVNDEKNGKLYARYKELAEGERNVIFGGRLGEYKYYDMDAVIASALNLCERELK